MPDFIPIYQPKVCKNQKKYVVDCLDSNWISSRGKYIDLFEERLQEYLGVDHVITCSNGSVSLILILKALNIGPGDEVVTQSLTYAATVSSILNVGATPVLIDSTSNYQMNIESTKKAITKKTKAVMVAQLYGDSCDLDKLSKICKENNIYLIEDSAECFGCNWKKNIKIGSLGVASSFSFFGNKTITTGEGGCVATNNKELADKMRLLKSQNHIGSFKHKGPGYNFRMTNPQAAVGLAQLEEIDSIIKRKKDLADYYRENLSSKIGRVVPSIESSEWMPLFTLPDTITYMKFATLCREKGIDTRPCFTPIHVMEGFKIKVKKPMSVCEKIFKTGFNLPSYPDLTQEDLRYIVTEVNQIVEVVG